MELRAAKDVLIVDDDDGLRTMICAALQQAGLTCDTIDQGLGALDHMRRTDYAVVLLDLVMPRLDGIQVLHELERRPLLHSRKPVVMIMTGMPEREWPPVPEDFAHAVLRKPLDIDELTALVVGCVSARQSLTQPPPLREMRP